MLAETQKAGAMLLGLDDLVRDHRARVRYRRLITTFQVENALARVDSDSGTRGGFRPWIVNFPGPVDRLVLRRKAIPVDERAGFPAHDALVRHAADRGPVL